MIELSIEPFYMQNSLLVYHYRVKQLSVHVLHCNIDNQILNSNDNLKESRGS